MRRVEPIVVLLVAVLAVGCTNGPAMHLPTSATSKITPQAFEAHVNYLARPARGGRPAATAGNRVAGDYIAQCFQRAGLTPGGDHDTFFQTFTCDRLRVPADNCTLTFASPGEQDNAIIGRLGKDFAPSAQGKLGAFSAPLVFAGYGLHNHIRNYNDYANLSARGCVVMVLAGEPHGPDGQSRWAVRGDETHLASLAYKLRLARRQGAVGVLVVAPPDVLPHESLDDVLGDCTGTLPAVRISREFANRLLSAGGEKRSVSQLVGHMHQTGKPDSFAIGGRLTGKVAMVTGRCRNVIGILRPDAIDDGRVIIVGAHYDHLPITGQLAKDSGLGIRCGADDNASGVAAMLMLAEALAATPGRHSTYVFIAFDAEEIGFVGSRYYVQHPALPLDRVDVMINIDQVGYVERKGVMILGDTLDDDLVNAIREARRRSQLRVKPLPFNSDSHWSDQAPFVRTGVPTLFVYGYRTSAYHTRRDTADRVNADGGAAVSQLIYVTLYALNSAKIGYDGR